MEYSVKSFLGSDSHGDHWMDQERDENGRWSSGGAHSGSDNDPTQKAGYKGKYHDKSISWHDKKSPELEGMGAGAFRPFNVDAYHPKDVAKFSHDQAHTSYNQLIATARARFESNPKSKSDVSVKWRQENGFKDAKNYAHGDMKNYGAIFPGFENHHTWPAALGGSDHSKNLVWLTPAEHAVAHHLFAVMLTREPELYTDKARHMRDPKGTLKSLKGLNFFSMKYEGETRKYSDIGAKITKARDEKHVVGTHWLNEINNGFAKGKTASYNLVEETKAISNMLNTFNRNNTLSPKQAVSEFMKVSKAAAEHRPMVNPNKSSEWLLNGRQFGLEWAVGKFLTPKERQKFVKDVIVPLKGKSKGDPTAGAYTYKEAARQLHLASVIAREYATDKIKYDKAFKSIVQHTDYTKTAKILSNTEKEYQKNKRNTDNYAVMNVKNGKITISWKKFTSGKNKSVTRIELMTIEYYEKRFDEDQERDEQGRWTSGGGGGGSVGHQGLQFHRPLTATVQRMTPQKLLAQKPAQTAELVMRAAIGKTSKGVELGATLPAIYAKISHATGVAQGPELTRAVDKALKYLDREGKIKVELRETPMKYGKDDPFQRAGKLAWERNPDGDWQVKSLETYHITVAGSKTKEPIESQHSLGTRPHKFDPEPGSLAEKALDFRREEFPDSRFAPQGRYHSSLITAPEMMLGDEREDLFAKGKITEKELNAKSGTKVGANSKGEGGKYIRNEYYHPRDVTFFDATSSVTAHIGAMTGDEVSLKMSKLLDPGDSKPAHHDLATKALGVKEKDTTKPYYTVLSNIRTGESLTPADFEGIKPGGIKEIVKSIWTPGSYGSKPHQMAKNVEAKMKAAGVKPELIKSTTAKMLENFKETELYQFTPKFKDIMREAPENFVYTNPMSGFNMSFNKYKDETHRITLDGKQIKSRIPGDFSKIRTLNGSAALFIQNWDSAAIANIALSMKSPYTVHDAIGINKDKDLKKLHETVAKTMQKVHDLDPLKNLADQIIKAHKANNTPEKQMKRIESNLKAALAKLKKSTNKRIKFSSKNNHFVEE